MEIPEYLKWIVGTIVALGSLVGVGKLFEIRAIRRHALQDKNDSIHQSNQVRQIDFDQFAFQKFAERLETVESELKDLREKLSVQMANNARLEAENKHLKETNERQEKEMISLREDRRILSGQVNSLTNIVTKLQTQIEAMQKT